jgi:hypothetical protein
VSVRRVFPPHAAEVRKAVAALSRDEQRTLTGLLKRLGLGAAQAEPAEE